LEAEERIEKKDKALIQKRLAIAESIIEKI